jgi:tRNA-specific 2-thiouridylase
MSGGVDSSVAACLLKEQGYECVGLFMRVGVDESRNDEASAGRHQGCCSAADASDARAVAGRAGIPLYVLNFKADFARIIDYFSAEYVSGRTPNPCVVCNRDLKFGKLLNYADAVRAEYVATGHYARIDRSGGTVRLRRAADEHKDQSYVLFPIRREVLPRVLLPLGAYTKPEVRRLAARFGLRVHDKPDSAEICFVPDRDYARVVREQRPEAFVAGEVRDEEGNVLGRHEGIANFTIGQRRGVGIATGQPVYVIAIDARTQTVTIGPRASLLARRLTATGMNWLGPPPTGEGQVHAQIRSQHRAAPARLRVDDESACAVIFDEPQSAITPGQAVVLYDGDVVLGGGWIDRVERE